MPYGRKIISQRLRRMHSVIYHSLYDDRIAGYAKKVGYSREDIEELMQRYEQVQDLRYQRTINHGDQRRVTYKMKQKMADVRRTYMNFVKIGRIVFKNRETSYNNLGLRGDRNKDRVGLMAQMQTYYFTAKKTDMIMETLEGAGVTEDRLDTWWKEVETVRRYIVKQVGAIGQSQVTTALRNRELTALESDVNDLRALIKIAAGPDNQLLEMIGITVRSK